MLKIFHSCHTSTCVPNWIILSTANTYSTKFNSYLYLFQNHFLNKKDFSLNSPCCYTTWKNHFKRIFWRHGLFTVFWNNIWLSNTPRNGTRDPNEIFLKDIWLWKLSTKWMLNTRRICSNDTFVNKD